MKKIDVNFKFHIAGTSAGDEVFLGPGELSENTT